LAFAEETRCRVEDLLKRPFDAVFSDLVMLRHVRDMQDIARREQEQARKRG